MATDYQSETVSRRVQDHVVILRGRKFEARADIIGFQERVVGQDFRPRRTMRQHFQHILHPQPVTTNARPSAAFASFDRYT